MDDDLGEVIVESTRNGVYLKVTAVHVATGIEATAVGPAAEPKAVVPPVSRTKAGENSGLQPQKAPQLDPIGGVVPRPAPSATPRVTPGPRESVQNQGF